MKIELKKGETALKISIPDDKGLSIIMGKDALGIEANRIFEKKD